MEIGYQLLFGGRNQRSQNGGPPQCATSRTDKTERHGNAKYRDNTKTRAAADTSSATLPVDGIINRVRPCVHNLHGPAKKHCLPAMQPRPLLQALLTTPAPKHMSCMPCAHNIGGHDAVREWDQAMRHFARAGDEVMKVINQARCS